MEYRSYLPKDALGLDKLLDDNKHGDVRLGMDQIIVSGPVGDPSGILIWRPMALIHTLVVPRTLGMKRVADGLVAHARRTALDRICFVQEAAFVIDQTNSRMLDYARNCGAVSEDGQLMYAAIKIKEDSTYASR